MSRSPAEILAAIRPQVLDALVSHRGTVDQVYHEMGDDELRSLYDVLLGKLNTYVGDRDPTSFRGYVRRWVAMRVGAGARHESLIPALTVVGDRAIEVAQAAVGDTDEVRALMRILSQANFLAARVVVEVLADEFRRRRRQLDLLAGEGEL